MSAAPQYTKALREAGYKVNFDMNNDETYKPNRRNRNKRSKNNNRSRNIMWFLPPFSVYVKTNIGQLFLKIIKETLLNQPVMNEVFSLNNIKISYKTGPSIQQNINSHNRKILANYRREMNLVRKPATKSK